VPNLKMARALAWAHVGLLGLFGMLALMSTFAESYWPESPASTFVRFALAALNIFAFMAVLSIVQGPLKPHLQVNSLPNAVDLTMGRFLLHAKRPGTRTPLHVWIPFIAIAVLYVGVAVWRKSYGLPEHAEAVLVGLALATLALSVALFHAWRLRRQARAEALEALNASSSSHAAQPPAVD
jgi:uncharacterized PurR-regulated membrane protein YhhQ (DUF165 family)